jgi:hypothetical protein
MYKSNSPALTTIDGQAIEVFPFWPNYRRDFIERWEWKTDILTAYAGNEQRIQLRQHPRRSFEYEIFAQKVDRAAVENILWRSPLSIFAVPDWNNGIRLTAAMIPAPLPSSVLRHGSFGMTTSGGVVQSPGTSIRIGGTTLTTGSTTRSMFIAGGYVIAFMSPTEFELHELVSITDTTITTKYPFTGRTPAMLYPALLGRLNLQQSLNRVTSHFTSAIVTFNLLVSESVYSGWPSTFPVYRDIPVMEVDFNWEQGVVLDTEFKAQLIDMQTNDPQRFIESQVPLSTHQAHWFLNGGPAIVKFLKYLHGFAGRLGEFWAPTYTADAFPISVSGNNLEIQESGYANFVKLNSSRAHIRVVKTNGEILYRKILKAVLYKRTTELLVLDTPLGITASEIKLISFMSLARFDQDRIELAYKGPGFATAQISIRTLIHDL